MIPDSLLTEMYLLAVIGPLTMIVAVMVTSVNLQTTWSRSKLRLLMMFAMLVSMYAFPLAYVAILRNYYLAEVVAGFPVLIHHFAIYTELCWVGILWHAAKQDKFDKTKENVVLQPQDADEKDSAHTA